MGIAESKLNQSVRLFQVQLSGCLNDRQCFIKGLIQMIQRAQMCGHGMSQLFAFHMGVELVKFRLRF